MATARPVSPSAEAVAHGLDLAALSAAVRRPSATPELLRELLRRQPATLRATLEGIVADPARPAPLRTIATVGLAGLRDARSVGALVRAARDPDVALARRAVEALGRLGSPDDLPALRELRLPDGAAARSLAFARSLIAYRHGLDGERVALPRGSSASVLDPARARALPVSRLTAASWTALQPELQGAERSLAPVRQPPLEIHCGKDRLLLMVNPVLDNGATAVQALGQPRVAAVLMKFSPTLGRWFLAEYVLSHPVRGGAAQLVGVRPSGRVVHTGTAARAGDGVQLQLSALDSPLAAPTLVRVRLGPSVANGLDLQAQVEPDKARNRRGPQVPQPA